MADRNLAKMIWEIAKADKSFDGLELKQMYKKKIRIDTDVQRENLKKIVAEHIKNHYQPVKSEMVLNEKMIIGGKARYTYHQIRPNRGDPMTPEKMKELDESIYAYKHDNFSYGEVTGIESKNLIKHAIIPLDLKWRLNSCQVHGFETDIVISWKHWPEN